jgi:hypothetical protein
VISLLALLFAWTLYIINSFKLYSKTKFDSLDKIVGASCFVSIIGYLVSSIFNDHVTSVAPLFWVILGLGISINMRLQRKSTEA